jgi:hypothetical protein
MKKKKINKLKKIDIHRNKQTNAKKVVQILM